MKRSRIRIHKRTLQLLDDPRYVYICVNPDAKLIATCACGDGSKDAVSVRKKRDCEIYSSGFFYEIGRLSCNLDGDCTYRIEGNVEKSRKRAEFNILDAVAMDRHTGLKTQRKG